MQTPLPPCWSAHKSKGRMTNQKYRYIKHHFPGSFPGFLGHSMFIWSLDILQFILFIYLHSPFSVCRLKAANNGLQTYQYNILKHILNYNKNNQKQNNSLASASISPKYKNHRPNLSTPIFPVHYSNWTGAHFLFNDTEQSKSIMDPFSLQTWGKQTQTVNEVALERLPAFALTIGWKLHLIWTQLH